MGLGIVRLLSVHLSEALAHTTTRATCQTCRLKAERQPSLSPAFADPFPGSSVCSNCKLLKSCLCRMTSDSSCCGEMMKFLLKLHLTKA